MNLIKLGLEKGFSTTDNLFILYSLINILSNNKKKLFSAFIGFKSAFDTVWRLGLWRKLLRYNINGRVFTVIKNMYSNVKSYVRLNTDHSNFFTCNMGVRQGENLSPFLFSIFLNDLEEYLRNNDVDGINCETPDIENELYIYLKLCILLYADDTVILSESETGLQHALNVFQNYCKEWQLTVNVDKTKVLIFSKGRPNRNYNFVFNDKQLEIVNEYKYLGIFMSRSGSFLKTKKYIAEQGSKAMYSLLSKVRKFDLPFDITIDLYNKMVLPVLLY
ncbi:MAG: reverse transcriptase family protein, partial [Candidatus Thiodiazotropha sp.]